MNVCLGAVLLITITLIAWVYIGKKALKNGNP